MYSGSVLLSIPFPCAQTYFSGDKRNTLHLWYKKRLYLCYSHPVFSHVNNKGLHISWINILLQVLDTFALCHTSNPLVPHIYVKDFLECILGHQLQKASQNSDIKLPFKQYSFNLSSLKIWNFYFIFYSQLLGNIWGILFTRSSYKKCQLFFLKTVVGYLNWPRGLLP